MYYDAAIKEDGLYLLQLNHRDAHDVLVRDESKGLRNVDNMILLFKKM